jgi:hypothetical protein
MATARTALQGLLTAITPAGGWAATTPPTKAAVGWPGQQIIQGVAQGGYTLVAVFDAGDGAKNSTRWAGYTAGSLDVQPPAPGLLATLSKNVLAASGTCTVTLSGSPNVNDAVVFAAQPILGAAALANAVAGSSDTLTTLAAALAVSITASGLGLSATATGAVVTVTASSTTPLCALTANTGNVGQRTQETKRMTRHVRVIVWATTEAIRETVGNAIDQQLGVLDDIGGVYLSNAPLGDWLHIHSEGDMLVEEQLADIFRWDFRVALEYGTLSVEALYPVLGTSFDFTPSPPQP